MKKQNSLWVEKFRSTKLEDYLCSPELREKIQKWITENDVPHAIFAGSAGLGKSTLAKLIVKNIKCDYLYINASDENGIETIREKVKSFASSASFSPLKVIILEEASFLTQPAQEALKQIIEDYSATTRFIFTCNHLEKIIEPIKSRCEGNIHIFGDVAKGEIAKHIVNKILEVEKVTYDIKDVVKAINHSFPDIRAIIGNIQANVMNNKFTWVEPNIESLTQVLEILKKPTKTSWVDLRQIIANSQMDDYQSLIVYLFEHIDEFAKGYEAEVIIELDESQWRSRTVPDKEISIVSLMSKLLTILKPKLIKG